MEEIWLDVRKQFSKSGDFLIPILDGGEEGWDVVESDHSHAVVGTFDVLVLHGSIKFLPDRLHLVVAGGGAGVSHRQKVRRNDRKPFHIA